MSTFVEQYFSVGTGVQYSPKIKQNPCIEQKKEMYKEKQEIIFDQDQPNVPEVSSQNIDETQAHQFFNIAQIAQALFLFLIVAILIYFLIKKFRSGKQQNQRAEVEFNQLQNQRIQRQNHRQEEQLLFKESTYQQTQQTDVQQNTEKWGEKNSKNRIQTYILSDEKFKNKDSKNQQIQDVQKIVDSMNNDYNKDNRQDNQQNTEKVQLDDQKTQIFKPPQQQFDNCQTLSGQQQSDLSQKQHPNDDEEIESYENNQFKQQIHQGEQQNITQQEEQERQQNRICAYEILNQKFYIPSFKSRQIDDNELKKFVRTSKNVKSLIQEYNLDGSQEQLFLNEIQEFIPIRGDGNCLFTSIGLQFIFYNLMDNQRYERLVGLVQKTEFQQIYKQTISENGQQREVIVSQLEKETGQDILMRRSFLGWIDELKKGVIEQQKEINEEPLLKLLIDLINNQEGPFYGLLIIFMRNYFRSILQDFYSCNEMNYLIQNPELIQEINTWEHMYDETDIALKLFASKEQILIKCYQKMNVDDKIVNISEYKADDQQQFQYQIGLAFQPGHYNVLKLKN